MSNPNRGGCGTVLMFVAGAAVAVPTLCSVFLTLDQALTSLTRATGLNRDELGTVGLWLAVAIVIVCVIWFIAEGLRRPD
jgi:hypothetical protein